jgi:hypothetical protein
MIPHFFSVFVHSFVLCRISERDARPAILNTHTTVCESYNHTVAMGYIPKHAHTPDELAVVKECACFLLTTERQKRREELKSATTLVQNKHSGVVAVRRPAYNSRRQPQIIRCMQRLLVDTCTHRMCEEDLQREAERQDARAAKVKNTTAANADLARSSDRRGNTTLTGKSGTLAKRQLRGIECMSYPPFPFKHEPLHRYTRLRLQQKYQRYRLATKAGLPKDSSDTTAASDDEETGSEDEDLGASDEEDA